MPIMEISIVPVGTKTASLSSFVARAVKILKQERGIKYTLTSMGTIVEADNIERLFRVARKMHQSVFRDEVKRVVTTIKIDDRKDKELTIEGKIKSVKGKLNEEEKNRF